MSGTRLSPQIHVDLTPNDGSVAGQQKARISNSVDSQIPSTGKTGQGTSHHLSPPDAVHDDATSSHRRYRSKAVHKNKFQQLVESSRAKPNGVLAIHVKVGHIQDIDSEGEFFTEATHLFVYLRMLCVDYVKYSRVYIVDEVPTTIIFDELKHFSISVGAMKPDSFCFVRFELLAYEESNRNRHRVFATKEISLMHIIRCMNGTASLGLWREEREVAELDIEACFASGALGYGYSSLFVLADLSARTQLAWSMFCRLTPPLDQTADTKPGSHSGELILCRDTPRPGIVNFTRRAVLRPGGGQRSRTQEPEPASPLVGGLIGRRLAKAQLAFSQLKNRQERLKYLREFVVHPFSKTEETLISDDVHYFEELNLRRTTVQSDASRLRFSIFTNEPDNKGDDDIDVKSIASVVDASPGVVRRRQVKDPVENQVTQPPEDRAAKPSTATKT